MLWELVHVFFDHRGLLEGREPRAVHDTGASSFLYPFLVGVRGRPRGGPRRRPPLGADQGGRGRRAARADAEREPRTALVAAAARAARAASRPAASCSPAATAARQPTRWTSSPTCAPRPQRLAGAARRIDLTEDSSILTAIANDVGVAQIFQRQVIAYGREGDALVVLSTSGNSENLIVALAEARRRGLATVAFVGYDGGRIAGRGARRPRRRHPLAAHPADPGGAGERLPRACAS